MTTSVLIRSPRNNHQDVLVEVLGCFDEGGIQPILSAVVLTDGEEQTFYVHDGQFLYISEVEKNTPTQDEEHQLEFLEECLPVGLIADEE